MQTELHVPPPARRARPPCVVGCHATRGAGRRHVGRGAETTCPAAGRADRLFAQSSPRDHARITGRNDTERVAELGDEFFRRVDEGAPLRPGAQRLLSQLADQGVPFALVSASPRTVVDSVARGALAHVPFAFTLSADDTVRTKPHPDPYRAAAERFGVPPAACVAVEDSPDGAASAEAAGCALLVVPSLLPVPPSPRRIFADSLDEIDAADLHRYVEAGPQEG
ncbi:HAD family hydrolase [Streptomyces sp. NBC_00984]|nr:HAD family hydrolase [Streptomyces sp. NBC_00984]